MYCVQIHCTVCTACRCEGIPLTVDLGPCLPYRVPKSHILSFQYTPIIERERKRSRGGGSVCGLHQQVWQRPQTDIAARTLHVPLSPVASREAAAESASPCLPLSAPPATWTLTPPHRTPPPRHPPGVEGLRYRVCVSTCIPINAHLSTSQYLLVTHSLTSSSSSLGTANSSPSCKMLTNSSSSSVSLQTSRAAIIHRRTLTSACAHAVEVKGHIGNTVQTTHCVVFYRVLRDSSYYCTVSRVS